ncbi:hypothetical protein KS4_25330 [Poriferisphaera corsica]|uniref:DUF4328 domain-containing protein n=1 Tax=Poriferisphaera corsica TaxID=2528020 RepID=A0A517YW53_9BACT|nr:hypothetical protein [Poriferisphaera corsica]QDU34463.1 hypothetical protein KS4_25330 [Poriferisphaera corsica]
MGILGFKYGVEEYKPMGGLVGVVCALLMVMGVGAGGGLVWRVMGWAHWEWWVMGVAGVGVLGIWVLMWWGVRVYENVRGLGAKRLFFDGDWLIWTWLLPGLNGVGLPLMVMEWWRGSVPNEGVSDGHAWRWSRWGRKVWCFGVMWWLTHFAGGCWMVSFVLDDGFSETLRGWSEYGLLVGLCGACLIGVVVVVDIEWRQRARFAAREAYLVAAKEKYGEVFERMG